MSSQRIPLALRRRVAKTARYRCGYCLTSQHIVGPLLEIDHLLPEGRGGITEEDNLWLACPLCNGAKSDRVEVVDPTTGQICLYLIPGFRFGQSILPGLRMERR